MTMSQVLDSVVEKCQSLITGKVHLKYTRDNVTGRYKHAKIVIVEDINKDVRNSFGFTPNEHVSWINANPFGECYIYINKIRESPCLDKYRTENQAFPPATSDPSLFPFTSDELANALASVATHETGHTLGLVHRILYGTTRSHNKTNSGNGFIMNNGIPFMQLFAKPSALKKSWNSRNHEYLILDNSVSFTNHYGYCPIRNTASNGARVFQPANWAGKLRRSQNRPQSSIAATDVSCSQKLFRERSSECSRKMGRTRKR